MSRAAILVLGMHRSGTSALAWLLGRLGAALPGDGIGPHGDNRHGYFESAALVKADDQLLRVCRSSWFDPRPLGWRRLETTALASRRDRIGEAIDAGWGTAPLIAVKDPRQCRFVPVVVEALAARAIEPRAVLASRAPAEIAGSLGARDGTSPAYAHLLWLRHMIDAERDTRGMARAIVSYDGLLGDWRDAVDRLAPLAGREGWQPEGEEAAAIDAFLDPALRRHREAGRPSTLEEPLAGLVAGAAAALAALMVTDDAVGRAAMDRAGERLDALGQMADDIVHDELRHRRMPPPDAAPVAPEPSPPAVAAASSVDPATFDHDADAALIRASGVFDADWYRDVYGDVAGDPVDHYVRVGAALGHKPHPLFDTGYYARQMARRDGRGGRGA